MKIAFISYYNRDSFNLSASDGTRENGNLRFLEILNQLNKEKINYEIYKKQNHEDYFWIREIFRRSLLSFT